MNASALTAPRPLDQFVVAQIRIVRTCVLSTQTWPETLGIESVQMQVRDWQPHNPGLKRVGCRSIPGRVVRVDLARKHELDLVRASVGLGELMALADVLTYIPQCADLNRRADLFLALPLQCLPQSLPMVLAPAGQQVPFAVVIHIASRQQTSIPNDYGFG